MFHFKEVTNIDNNIGIYRFVNNINGKSYVGKSKDLRHRYNDHMRLLRAGNDLCPILNKAWQKYGEENFSYEILCFCDESELNEKERYYIEKYDSFKNGYNCTKGGDGMQGFSHSEESKRKIGDAFRGKKLSEEHKRKMSEQQKGKHLTQEHKEALRASWTDERRLNNSLNRSGPNHPSYGRTGAQAYNKTPVICSTGEFFYTLRDAANWCGLKTNANISTCCHKGSGHAGKHPVTNEPLSWRYATKDEIIKYETQYAS